MARTLPLSILLALAVLGWTGCARSGPGAATSAQVRPTSVPPDDTASRAARNILTKCQKVYEALQSFNCRQTGRMHSRAAGGIDMANEVTFYFRRPDQVRAEAREPSNTVLVARGKRVTTTGAPDWVFPEGYHHVGTSLDDELSFSGVTAGLMPMLLGLPGSWPDSMRPASPRVAGRESIDSHECYRIVGLLGDAGTVTYWVDTRTFLLRRRVYRMAIGGRLPRGIEEGYGKAWRAQGEQGRKLWEQIEEGWEKQSGEVVVQEDSFTDIRMNPKLSDALFVAR